MKQKNTKKNILWALEKINEEPKFKKFWDLEFPNNTIGEVWNAVRVDLVSEDIRHGIFNVCPVCYEINDIIFLHGEEKGSHDFIEEWLDLTSVIELFDMTEEMDSGHSYSFYISSVDYLKKASARDCYKVRDYMSNL